MTPEVGESHPTFSPNSAPAYICNSPKFGQDWRSEVPVGSSRGSPNSGLTRCPLLYITCELSTYILLVNNVAPFLLINKEKLKVLFILSVVTSFTRPQDRGQSIG